jgi:hypothetical protein
MFSLAQRRTLASLTLLIAAAVPLRIFAAANLSPLSVAPDWTKLEKYQETITHDDFKRLLETVYCSRGVSEELIKVEDASARILITKSPRAYFKLRFAESEMKCQPLARKWNTAQSLPSKKPSGPLSDIRIALDPGHIGGKWAKMEERWFQLNGTSPVQEGDMTLHVAQLLAPRLRELGSRVMLVRDKLQPVTARRPGDFEDLAKKILKKGGFAHPREDFEGPADPEKEHTVRWQTEILFYRNSEIRRRAKIVNTKLRPDLVLCLHFNAEAWGDPRNPELVEKNHLHALVNGAYLPPELEFDDERFEMIRRLLSRAYDEEIGLAEKLTEKLAATTGLPAYEYVTDNVTKVGPSGYVYARNLMATRLYACPVVYLEPYVMNSREVFARVQAGDYDGVQTIEGKERPSIFREYVEGVVDGLLDYYNARP